jgi:pyruvate,water dikinase
VALVLKLMFDVHTDKAIAGKTAPRTGEGRSRFLKGFAVSPGSYEGPVRIVRSEDDLAKVQQGEVLVAVSTGPTFNLVLPLIGALVTERGGVLSHAAIVSREYGLPGVVGCVGATTLLRDGQRVRVDGETGEVCTLS